MQAATLHFDAKQKQLADSLVDFDYQLKQLNAATTQYARLRESVETYLKEQQNLVLNVQMQKVREQLESIDAKKQAKFILVKMIEDDRIDEVIGLLGAMKTQSRKDILRAFNTDADMEMLYRVQRKMSAGEPAKSFIDGKLKELEQLKQQDK